MHGPPERAGALVPPLKWAGGKRWQVPKLRTLWAAHAERRLVRLPIRHRDSRSDSG